MIKLETYLTEAVLGQVLAELFPLDSIKKQYKFSGNKFKYDYALENSKILVEFDGYRHYCDVQTIQRDALKSNVSEWDIIRIPYYVQLEPRTVKYFFGQTTTVVDSTYPHGWIDKKAMLPASYCELGVERCIQELEMLPVDVMNECLVSLTNRPTASKYVYPKMFEKLIQS